MNSKINLSYISDIIGDDTTTLKAIIEEFIHTTPKDLEHLERVLDENNYIKSAEIAHKLKSVFRDLGLPDIAKKAAEIEAGAREKTPFTKLVNLFQEINQTYELAEKDAMVILSSLASEG